MHPLFAFRSEYAYTLRSLGDLPPDQALLLRSSGFALFAHEAVVSFHRWPGLTAVGFRVEDVTLDATERYAPEGRNGFWRIEGEPENAWDEWRPHHGLPLGLMAEGEYRLERSNPHVQASLGLHRGGTRQEHDAIVRLLAQDIDIGFPRP